MEIEFRLNRKEYSEFLKLAYKKVSIIGNGARKFFFINFFIWVFVGMGFAGIFKYYEVYAGLDFKPLNYTLIFWGIGLLGFIAATIYQRKYYTKYALADDGHILKLQKVSFDDKGVHISTEGTEQFFSWAVFQDIEYSDKLICLYIDTCQAILIPTRVISGDTQKEELQRIIDGNMP